MINYATKSNRDGKFYHIYSSITAVKMCGYTEEDIWEVDFEENIDGDYWSFQDTGEEKFSLIFPYEVLFNICFAYGPQAEVERGRGRIVRLKVKEAKKYERNIG